MYVFVVLGGSGGNGKDLKHIQGLISKNPHVKIDKFILNTLGFVFV